MIKPKKSLGQNFLQDKNIVQKIIASANLSSDDFVIEIGPGHGILTEELVKKTEKVLAIEIDQNLISSLQKKFSKNKAVEIINEDILKININKLVPEKYKVIANIPYYITSKIIRLFLEADHQPEEIILMIQKEVAERIIEKPGKMSLLSVSVKYYAEPKILFNVSRNSFFPIPEVDSSVIKISNIKKQTGSKKFFQIVRAGFSAKRKTLVNNLSNSLHLTKSEVVEKIKTVPLNRTARAQELSIENWKKLSQLF